MKRPLPATALPSEPRPCPRLSHGSHGPGPGTAGRSSSLTEHVWAPLRSRRPERSGGCGAVCPGGPAPTARKSRFEEGGEQSSAEAKAITFECHAVTMFSEFSLF